MTIPNSIDSNVTGLAFAEESSLKTLPGSPVWYALEPNSYTDFGASFSRVARNPITNTRQQPKGTITDLEAKAGFQQDLTQNNLLRLLQGFFWQDAFEKPTTAPIKNAITVAITGVTTGPNVYAAASGLDIFKVGHLVLAKGFNVPANNGLKVASAIAA